LLVVAAAGQVLFQLLRGTHYGNVLGAPGDIVFVADLALVAGLILIVLGVFRLLRRFESRLSS
jgi:hypothetical protein